MGVWKRTEQWRLWNALRVARAEAHELAYLQDVCEREGKLDMAERYQQRLIVKLKAIDYLAPRVEYDRPIKVKRVLCSWNNGGEAERFTRHWRILNKHYLNWKKGPKRRKWSAAFPRKFVEMGSITPYPGEYRIYRISVPRWYGKRYAARKHRPMGKNSFITGDGRTIYYER